MSVAEQKTADPCPICGRPYERVIEPPHTEIIHEGDGDDTEPIEQELLEGTFCVFEVAGEAFVYSHVE